MNVRRLLIPIIGVVMVVLLVLGLRGPKRGPSAAQKAQQQVVTKPIARAAAVIAQGAEIGQGGIETANMTDEQIAKEVPSDAINDPNLLIGATAKVPIAPGDYFTPANIEPAPAKLSQKVEPGFLGITIPAPEVPSLYDLAFLKPGDRVDVFGVSGGPQSQEETVSVRLASNVRILAVDTVMSEEKEKKRIADINAEIEKIKADKQKAMSATPPPTAEALKGFDDQIAALQEQLDVKPENPSVTLEVTPAQSQSIALWRKSATINLALHREEDAQQIIFDQSMAMVPGASAGERGVANPAGAGRVLTLNDVVPLDQRDPAEFLERQQALEEARQGQAEQQVEGLERQVRMAELRAEMRNVQRYGTRSAPPLPPVAAVVTPPPAPAPVVVQRSGVSDAQYNALRSEVRNLRKAV
ncbi:MAG: Flp pilus assembly protein CpaB, partial [Armatimonadetes bacterium]|nr:Flp pilus assembly protein CpaB [Armatimonadota bacterium]